MDILDYSDRFIANLLVGGTLTCWAMSVVQYFDWFDDGIAGMHPEVVQVCLVAVLVTAVLLVWSWVRRVLAGSRSTPFADTPTLAGAWRARVTGMALGLFATASIIMQLR